MCMKSTVLATGHRQVDDRGERQRVGEEEWHRHQVVTPLPDGGIQLEVPYSKPQEIMMDILRHGQHVEVIRPASLRSAVADALRQKVHRPEDLVARFGGEEFVVAMPDTEI